MSERRRDAQTSLLNDDTRDFRVGNEREGCPEQADDLPTARTSCFLLIAHITAGIRGGAGKGAR